MKGETQMNESGMQVSSLLLARAATIRAARHELEEAKRSMEEDKQRRQSSLWARLVVLLTTTPVEKAIEHERNKLNALMTSAGSYAEKWISEEARSSLQRSSVDAARHSAQVKRTVNAQERLNRVLPLWRLAETAHSKLDQARRDCESASGVEMLDLLSTNNAVSLWSSMETSSAADSIESARRAVKALADALPKRTESISVEAPNDMLDLFVDIVFQPALDVLSWFAMGRLDDAARQCRNAAEKMAPLLSQLSTLRANTAARVNAETEALRAIEVPYLQAAAALVPKEIGFKLPSGLK